MTDRAATTTPLSLRELQDTWHSRVGDRVARRCWPAAVTDGVLVIGAAARDVDEIRGLASLLLLATPRDVDCQRVRRVSVVAGDRPAERSAGRAGVLEP